MDERMSLANVLQQAMKARGRPAARLAQEAGIPRSTISRWLSGQTPNPYSDEHLLRVAAALELPRAQANQLFRAAGLPTIDQRAAGATTPVQRALLERWLVTPRNNLPAPLTSFVGREDEVVELASLLSEPEPRLLTLTGPGGSGKTRLALLVAREAFDLFPDGVYFVPLAAVRDPQQVEPDIARTLGLIETPGASFAQRLAGYLRERRLLLVLDNLEQVVAAGAEITALLAAAPRVKALVTSRVALHVYGEHIHVVDPLDLPAPDRPFEALRANAAVALFAERAQAANDRFRLTPTDAGAVAEICARLDGLPLAIELAAARSAQFTPQELLDAFPRRLDLGAEGPADVAERQRTLRAAIAWSVDLLPPVAQQLAARLSVFAGGWTLEAAARVCGAEGAPVAAGLAALRDASLISGGGARFSMLETIRDYLAERLAASGEAEATRDRHARWCGELAATIPAYSGYRSSQAQPDIDVERANFAAALDWLLPRAPEAALALACALWPYWNEAGHYSDSARWLTAALAPGDALPAALRAEALTGLVVTTASQGDYPGATRLSAAALALADAPGDARNLALIELYRGLMAQHGGEIDAAAGWYRQSIAHWQSLGEPLGEARCHSELALLEAMRGEWAASEVEADAAEAIYRSVRDANGIARSLNDRGLVALMQGDISTALDLLREGTALVREQSYNAVLAGGLCYLGLAQQFAEQYDSAHESLSEALRSVYEAGDRLFISYSLFGLAGVAGGFGQPELAATLCGAAFAAQDAAGIVMPPVVARLYELGERPIREQLDDATFAAAFERGRQMPLDEAVALALCGSTSAAARSAIPRA